MVNGQLIHDIGDKRASLVTQMVKNPPAMWETWVGKIPWRRTWQPTPVLLPGESPWTEEPGGLQSMGSPRVRQTEQLSTAQEIRINNREKIVSSINGAGKTGLLHVKE